MAISISVSATQNSQNIANNTSNVTVTVKYSWTNGSYNHSGATLWITCDNKGNGGQTVKLNPSKTTSGSGTLATFTATVPHNTDGKKTVYFDAVLETGISSGTLEASGSKVLDQIPRAGSITAAPNFNDEDNPTISYSNPAGSSATVAACISLDGSADNIAYRTISATGSSYTFNLTTAERNVLRNSCTTSNSRTVRFYVRTTIGSNEYLSYLEKTLTIVNANPTVNPTVTDIDTGMIALTGDSNKIVRYYSNPQYTTNAAALKGATIKSYKVTCGGQSLTTASGTFYNVESNNIKFVVTDSRGNTTTKTVSKTLVPYVKLTCNIGGNRPNAQGEFNFTVKGNYFNSTFGTVANTLNVYYRYKADGDYSEWTTMSVTLSGNTYTATASLTGLDYQTTYTFQAYAVDKIATVETEETAIKSVPVFDWSKDDFNVNGNFNIKNRTVLRSNGDNNNIILSAEDSTDGIFLRPNGTGSNEGQAYLKPDGELVISGSIDSTGDIISRGAVSGASLSVSGAATVNSLTVNGRAYGTNKILWSGGYYMTADHTINLSEAISKQPNGIVLVFSAYDGGALDYWFSSHFVPKQMVALQNGKGSTFIMSAKSFSVMCCKYLYISDTSITGNEENNWGYTADSGITYDNSSFVLRYVIGV